MSENGLLGRSVEDVIATVVDREDERDPERVREALDPVTDDGTVTREAVEMAVADTSKVVATAETRVELARIAYEDIIAAAETVDDLAIVTARLDTFADRLEAVEARGADLADDLQTPVEQLDDPNAVYELAMELRDVSTTAQGVVQTADDLAWDIEQFESWLAEPDRRYDEFTEDVDLVDESLTELTAAVTALPADSDTPAAEWADATMRARVIELLVADLCVELTDLQTFADREDVQFRTDLEDQVAATERQTSELTDTLAEQAEPAWRGQFADALSALERDLDAFEPPVDWGRVQATLEQHREQAFDIN